MRKLSFIALCILLIFNNLQAQTKILFDATKAETAGNADWIIDADVANSPQRIPLPPQSGITATTLETYWTGAISAWGVDCAKRGYIVETLPTTGSITYGDATNEQDLSKYKIFVLCEPNIKFSATEKVAILSFVQNGGGLFYVADHDGADRNNDGFDAADIWNDFVGTANPFGILNEINNIGNDNSNKVANLPANDPILNGAAGRVTKLAFHAGSTFSVNSTANPSAKVIFYRSTAMVGGTTGAMCATSTYGKGKVVVIGDSSVADDSTGTPGNKLYNGYTGDPYSFAEAQTLIMNSTIWLASTATTPVVSVEKATVSVYPNPVKDVLNLNFLTENQNVEAVIYNAMGQKMLEKKDILLRGSSSTTIDTHSLLPGIYYLTLKNNAELTTIIFVVVNN